MQPTPPIDAQEIDRLRPRGGCLILAAPPVAIVAVFIAYAWLIYNGWVGRPADGDVVTLQFEACEAAAPVVQARVEDMGLGEPDLAFDGGRLTVRAQLPARPDAAKDIAHTLSQPGELEVLDDEGNVLMTSADIDYAGVRLDITMSPSTLVVMTEAGRDRVFDYIREHPGGKLHYRIDGTDVWSHGNQKPLGPGEIEIPPDAEDDQARIQLAASRGIALNNGPLPCPVSPLPDPTSRASQ